jgi:hypothetical protein
MSHEGPINNLPLTKPEAITPLSKEDQELADLKNLPATTTIDDLKKLYTEAEPWKYSTPDDPRTLTFYKKRILELWRDKFIASFNATSSTAERLKVLAEAPPGRDIDTDKILESNFRLRKSAVKELIQKTANIDELELVEDLLQGNYSKAENERINFDHLQTIKKKKAELMA